MRLFSPGFLLGVCFVVFFHTHLIFILTISLVGLLGWGIFLSEGVGFKLITSVLFGLFWAAFYLYCITASPISPELEAKPVLLTGIVTGLPENDGRQQHFYFLTHYHHQPLKVKLSWYLSECTRSLNGPSFIANLSAGGGTTSHWRRKRGYFKASDKDKQVRPGDVWQFRIKLKKPVGLHNPNSFNFEDWALIEGINATGYVSGQDKKIGHTYHRVIIDQLRFYLLQKIKAALPKMKAEIFIPGLTIGDRQQLTPEDWAVLQKTGANHLLAIAGLHIGCLTAVIYFLTRKITPFFMRRMRYITVPQLSAIIALMGAFMYAALSGFALPAQRAVIMLSVFLGAVILKKKLFSWQAYFVALFSVVFLNPLSVLSPSFWLSFGTVGMIIFAFTGRLKQRNSHARQFFNMQWVVGLGVLPLTILFFHTASVVSPLMNAISIPWVGFIVVPLSVLGALLLNINYFIGKKLLLFATYNMQGVWWLLTHAAQWHFSAQPLYFHHWYEIIFMFVAVVWLLSPRGFPAKYLSGFLLLPLFFPLGQTIPFGHADFTLLDVGQGLATVLRTQHHTLVYDAGPADPVGFDAGKEVVVPFLQFNRIKKVDMLMISHVDNDHVGGAKAILNAFSVKKLVTSSPEFFQKPFRATACKAGQHWQWDGVGFKVLSPDDGRLKKVTRNNRSCVLRVTTQHHHLLLTGDIEKSTEAWLVAHYPHEIQADILQVPHHGSRTSSSPRFIATVAPKMALFSVGYHNRYHLPVASVIRQYQQQKSELKLTSLSGAYSNRLN